MCAKSSTAPQPRRCPPDRLASCRSPERHGSQGWKPSWYGAGSSSPPSMLRNSHARPSQNSERLCGPCAARRPDRNLPAPFGARLSPLTVRSEEHTSELQSLMRNSYSVFCLKKKKTPQRQQELYTIQKNIRKRSTNK